MTVHHFDISQKSLGILRKNGWFSKRSVDTSACKIAWQSEGFASFKYALYFVSAFGGLKIIHESHSRNGEDVSVFDPVKATQRVGSAWVKEVYQPRINENILPVGIGDSEHLTYYMGERGGVYGGFDGFFCKIGETVGDAFENIFFNHQYITLKLA